MGRLIISVTICICVGSLVAPTKGSAESAVIETFKPALRTKTVSPTYPLIKQRMGQEGWVEMNFMIDPAGKPYDIAITDSTDPAFERAAAKALEEMRYAPATLKGEPIDSGSAIRITFALSGESGATKRFVNRYQRFNKAIQNKNKEKADKELALLAKSERNLYEEAYFQLAQYSHATIWSNDPLQQLSLLNRAAALDKGQGYLPDGLLTSLLQARLAKEVALKRYAASLKTAEALKQREIADELRQGLEKLENEVAALAASTQTFETQGYVSANTQGSHRLLKNSFSFSAIEGDIAELRVHCDRGFAGFIYEPDIAYTIDPKWNKCHLIMIGTPGTRYTLREGG